jgi:hypothetical protein
MTIEMGLGPSLERIPGQDPQQCDRPERIGARFRRWRTQRGGKIEHSDLQGLEL